jgi:peroxiredoxin
VIWNLVYLACISGTLDLSVTPPPPKEPSFAEEFRQIKADMDRYEQEEHKDWQAARTKSEAEQEAARIRIRRRRSEVGDPLAERAIGLVRPYAAEPAAVDVLTFVLRRYKQSHTNARATREATDLLTEHHLKDVKTLELASDFSYDPAPWTAKLLRALSKADLPRESKAKALYALAECLKTEAYLALWLPELERLDPIWAKVQERRYGKEYIQQLKADRSKIEAESVHFFNEVAEKYGDLAYPRGKNRTFREYARGGAFAVQNLGPGKAAPDFSCTDVSGHEVRFQELKGRVIVLDFWYAGCIPCAEQFPHLRQLTDKYAGKPFTIVGISADEDSGKWQEYLKRQPLPWTQWRSGRGGVVAAWNVTGFPTRYIIDHKGIIRDCDGLRDSAFDQFLDQLVKEASADSERR